MTSLPSRLKGAGPALLSIAAQSRRPDRLVLSLPRWSLREGCPYDLPSELTSILSEHPWMEVHWTDEDFGPGTKVLGALQWFGAQVGKPRECDVLMILDDDHAYLGHAVGELLEQQLKSGAHCANTFFAYFFRGLMVPQGADIVAMQLSDDFTENLVEYHRCFVAGDEASFLVDDLWLGMFLWLCGKSVVSLHELVKRRGFQMIYRRTDNAKVCALMDLGGRNSRDQAMVRAFDRQLAQLQEYASQQKLGRWGGQAAAQRVRQLAAEVARAVRRMDDLSSWIARAQGSACCSNLQKVEDELRRLRHLYCLQVPQPLQTCSGRPE